MWNVKTHFSQWLFMRPGAADREMNLDHELQLCGRTGTLHPRNYYAWNYRRWLLESRMDISFIREKEYREAKAWVERNVSDYSGAHHLACVVETVAKHGFDKQEEHLIWTCDLIVRFPGHEALWYHLRFLYTFFTDISIDGHSLIKKIINDTNSQEVKTEIEHKRQKELALCFGIWLCLLVRTFSYIYIFVVSCQTVIKKS